MKAALFLSVLVSAATGVIAADDLKIEVTTAVNCERKTQKGDTVSMHYRGRLASNNKEFDASYNRNRPLDFKVGAGQVIQGWDQGLLDMCIGEKRTLTIPPGLGYGQRAMGPIPAGSTLIFETELVGIKGVPEPDVIDYVKKEEEKKEVKEEVKEEKKEEVKEEKKEEKKEEAAEGVAEKVASVVSEATEAAKTIIADTDDAAAHEEL